MDNNDFKINYWSPKDYSYTNKQHNKRSFKKKISIVFCFLAVLIITPSLFFGVSNLKINNPKEVSINITTPSPEKVTEEIKTTPSPKTAPKPAPVIVKSDKKEVINNDSYWKISKRNCGTGKYYLSIRDQNEAKPLYKGEVVKVTCELN